MGHPQVRQGKQDVPLVVFFAQALLANFDVTKLAFDHSEWVFSHQHRYPNDRYGVVTDRSRCSHEQQ